MQLSHIYAVRTTSTYRDCFYFLQDTVKKRVMRNALRGLILLAITVFLHKGKKTHYYLKYIPVLIFTTIAYFFFGAQLAVINAGN